MSCCKNGKTKKKKRKKEKKMRCKIELDVEKHFYVSHLESAPMIGVWPMLQNLLLVMNSLDHLNRVCYFHFFGAFLAAKGCNYSELINLYGFVASLVLQKIRLNFAKTIIDCYAYLLL